MGLMVRVYRDNGGDFTGGGISARHDRLVVVNVPGPFEPADDMPAVRLERRGTGGAYLTPVDMPDDMLGPMHGGNFAACADSRFTRAVGFYGAVPIHDRFESQQTYNLLSQ